MRMFKTCGDCGASLDPCEKCDCKTKAENARIFFTDAYNEVFRDEFVRVYSDLKQKEVPSCIANDIAETAATKKASNVMLAALSGYKGILKRRG